MYFQNYTVFRSFCPYYNLDGKVGSGEGLKTRSAGHVFEEGSEGRVRTSARSSLPYIIQGPSECSTDIILKLLRFPARLDMIHRIFDRVSELYPKDILRKFVCD